MPHPTRAAALLLSAAVALLGACDSSASSDAATLPAAAADSARSATPAATDVRRAPGDTIPAVVRALYVNRYAAQSAKKMRKLIGVADSTEINAFVIDMKDEFGLNYASQVPMIQRNAGNAGIVRDLRAMIDTLNAHGILPIARIVVFKDSVTARLNPEWTIRREDNSIWRDRQGLAWVNPYHRALWEFNIGVAEELGKLGFREIQFDYIRFPEPYKSLPQQFFPESKGQVKADAIAEFLKVANARLDRIGVRTTADIFGLVTTVKAPLEIAQHWERLAPVTDVLLPMVYPSHYPAGSFGIKRPNADPYTTIHTALVRAHERNDALGITTPEHVRPWLQAFTLGAPRYGAAELKEQKRAVYDAGYDGWVLWSPGSQYDIFRDALEPTLVSRKRAWTPKPKGAPAAAGVPGTASPNAAAATAPLERAKTGPAGVTP